MNKKEKLVHYLKGLVDAVENTPLKAIKAETGKVISASIISICAEDSFVSKVKRMVDGKK